MMQTTVYLPEDLKRRLEQAARRGRRSEAAIVREALDEALKREEVQPTVPLFTEAEEEEDWGDPTLSERVDDLLAELGFGT